MFDSNQTKNLVVVEGISKEDLMELIIKNGFQKNLLTQNIIPYDTAKELRLYILKRQELGKSNKEIKKEINDFLNRIIGEKTP